ncbi:Plant UBX domain-containing protein 12 [Cardamine amara subsp. amara]|uniref:Plant UBX domain-containing protein 12 n=1 Tax=Cardamine amara subsp. amara TaxID=228776 RepID=A0ABD1BQD2_CARAN
MEKNSSPIIDIASLEIDSLRRIKRPKRFSDATAAAASNETNPFFTNAVFGFPQLPEEPPNRDWDLCRLCVRLPDGRRIQRNFRKSESVQLLWSFCYSQIDESERRKPFKLIQAFPGAYKTLHYGSNTTFDQSGLANSLVSVTWA